MYQSATLHVALYIYSLYIYLRYIHLENIVNTLNTSSYLSHGLSVGNFTSPLSDIEQEMKTLLQIETSFRQRHRQRQRQTPTSKKSFEEEKTHDRITNERKKIINDFVYVFEIIYIHLDLLEVRLEFEIYRKLTMTEFCRCVGVLHEQKKKRNQFKISTKKYLKKWIQSINPAHEKEPLDKSEKHGGAHRVTVSEAKGQRPLDRAKTEYILLRKWIDLLIIDEEDAMKTLDQIAFKRQLLLPFEEPGKSITDLAFLMKLLKTSSNEN